MVKTLSFLIGICVFILAFSGGMTYYVQQSRDRDVPEPIKLAYKKAMEGNEFLKRRQAVSALAQQEDRSILQTLAVLSSRKPPDMKMTRLEITENATNSVQIEGFASDPEIFNTYVSRLQSEKLFSKVTVDRITAAGPQNSLQKVVFIKADKAR